MNRNLLRLQALSLLCALVACQHISPATNSVAESFTLTDEERSLLRKRLGDRDRPRLALAMSGGGIRSSLFNFGVLKALYDDGILDDVDLVSSVSGGSYLTYWLYSEQLQYPDRPFGESIFADKHFVTRLCEFTASGNFVTLLKMSGSLAVMPVHVNAGRNLYERQMRWVFGRSDPKDVPVRMRHLRALTADHGHPYLIMNATTFGPRFNDDPWTRRVFEMTPLHYGSLDEHELWKVSDNDKDQSRLIQAALTSGAAIRPLKRRFTRPFASDAKGYAHLWDGGKSENLGAASALRRGPDRLIVIDAQLDKKSGPFGAYHVLRDRMDDLEMEVLIKEVTGPTRKGVYAGTAFRSEPGTVRPVGTSIVYIKMERPARLMEKLAHSEQKAPPDLIKEVAKRKEAFQAFEAIRGDYKGGQWQCDASLAGSPDLDALMYYNLSQYVAVIDNGGLYGRLLKEGIPLIGPYDFPRTTTFDQSMYLNQSLAYIALGYLTAKGQVKPLLPVDSKRETH